MVRWISPAIRLRFDARAVSRYEIIGQVLGHNRISSTQDVLASRIQLLVLINQASFA